MSVIASRRVPFIAWADRAVRRAVERELIAEAAGYAYELRARPDGDDVIAEAIEHDRFDPGPLDRPLPFEDRGIL